MTLEFPDGPQDPAAVYQLKVHGGLGDLLWVWKKVCTLDKPVFVHISEENRSRPRRSGILAAHLPNLGGWRFDGTTFASGGQDWTPASDPCCAIGRTWAQIKPEPGRVLKLECNRHLESGRRLEDWLPDLPTAHHFALRPPADPPTLTLRRPYVIFHLAGWPDVATEVWVKLINLFEGYCHAYVVGGSYDHRPRQLAEHFRGRAGVTLLEDLGWPDLYALLRGATHCFGHASGFTALADVLRVPGVVNNPRQHPKLLGTWNSNEHPAQVHCRAEQFEAYVTRACEALTAGGKGVWPPDFPAVARLTADAPTPAAAARAAVNTFRPSTLSVLFRPGAPTPLAADLMDAIIDAGLRPAVINLVAAESAQVAAVYAVLARTTRPARVELHDTPAGMDPTDLTVVWVDSPSGVGVDWAREGWRRVGPKGVLLALGPGSAAAVRSLGAALRQAEAVPVRDCPDAYYLMRGV